MGKRAMFAPSKSTVPASARRNPVMRLAAVLLPAPFGPISPTILPRATVKEQSSTARRPPKAFTRCCTSRMHVVAADAVLVTALCVCAPVIEEPMDASFAIVCLLTLRCTFRGKQGRNSVGFSAIRSNAPWACNGSCRWKQLALWNAQPTFGNETLWTETDNQDQ